MWDEGGILPLLYLFPVSSSVLGTPVIKYHNLEFVMQGCIVYICWCGQEVQLHFRIGWNPYNVQNGAAKTA